MAARDPHAVRTVCVNRKARFDYEILDRVEAGLVLSGSEVKALREGKGNLVDAYVMVRDGRAQVLNLEISRYTHDHLCTLAPRRVRGLLLHQREIRKLEARVREKGLTLVPLSVYFKGPWAKLEVALARGKRKSDKRESLKRREDQREMDRLRRHRR
ncbi:MAG: SsrA-binding protein SmpB [Planctomycetes bacterium]|nr:SsrA-binding protein SmpB [Planctomycetota bacterium]